MSSNNHEVHNAIQCKCCGGIMRHFYEYIRLYLIVVFGKNFFTKYIYIQTHLHELDIHFILDNDRTHIYTTNEFWRPGGNIWCIACVLFPPVFVKFWYCVSNIFLMIFIIWMCWRQYFPSLWKCTKIQRKVRFIFKYLLNKSCDHYKIKLIG